MKTILITGATGLIGTALSKKLISKGYNVRILSRKKYPNSFYWDSKASVIEEAAFENLDAIIHLAGAPVSKRWTNSYKKELYDSRVKSCDLLFQYAQRLNSKIPTFITASGANYYGTLTSSKIFKESDPHFPDFLGKICYDLEKSAQEFEDLGSRVCAVRTSAVLSNQGGMLKELKPMANSYVLSPLGSGSQILPWIHIDDIVNMYVHLLEKTELKGAYNAVASEMVNNKEFTQTFMKSLGKSVILPKVPSFVLKAVLGEMSNILLEGSALSNEKIKQSGFKFQFENLNEALADLAK